jgi:hypothetical protein
VPADRVQAARGPLKGRKDLKMLICMLRNAAVISCKKDSLVRISGGLETPTCHCYGLMLALTAT